MTRDESINVTIVSPWSGFLGLLLTQLNKSSMFRCTPQSAPVSGNYLRYGPETDRGVLETFANALLPIQPDWVLDETLEGDIRLEIGDSTPLRKYKVSVYFNGDEIEDALPQKLKSFGFTIEEVEEKIRNKNTMEYGAASPAVVRQMILWMFAQEGIVLSEEKKEYSDSDDIDISFEESSLSSKPKRERCRVYVVSDDLAVAQQVSEKLQEAGFNRVVVQALDAFSKKHRLDKDDIRFMVSAGAFSDSIDGAKLQVIASEAYDQLGIDAVRYPLVKDDGSDDRPAAMVFPIAAYREGSMIVYDGPDPDRFSITIFSEGRSEVGIFEEKLRAHGFTKINWRSFPDDEFAFRIKFGAAAKYPKIIETIRRELEVTMQDLGAVEGMTLEVEKSFSDTDADIYVFVPVDGVADGSLVAKKSSPSRYQCKIYCRDRTIGAQLMHRLESWSFESLKTEEEESPFSTRSSENSIRYGGAPVSLIERVAAEIMDAFGVEAKAKKQWSDSDNDIWISLSPDLVARVAGTAGIDQGEPSVMFWGDHPTNAGISEAIPFIEVQHDQLRVGSVRLKRRVGPDNPLVPAPDLFDHYCLDGITAETLHHIAVSVALCEPCLLEGETSTSKTSSIQYLASLLRQPVVRLNMHGQTDTGDLIGRWVPQFLGMELPFSAAELLSSMTLLESETRMILEASMNENRPLTRVEIQQIMANERMPSHPWCWQDGLIVQALRHGWWIILDEVNLAEPQILERLNSLLERDPQLVLSEHDGSVFGPSGQAIHPDFRIFATMNPAEYAGRTPLSPAYRNRWRGYRIVPHPTETQYLTMLHRVVFGKQPDISAVGRPWKGCDGEVATHAALSDIPGIADLLEALARFQVALENATGQRFGAKARIGVRRKERYVFTRRDLLSVLDFLTNPLLVGDMGPDDHARAAISRYYLSRVATSEDAAVVVDLLNAAGIGPQTWGLNLGGEEAVKDGDEPEGATTDLELEDSPDSIADGSDPDSLDTDMSIDEMADELVALFRFSRHGTVPPRAVMLVREMSARFSRPESAALKAFDKANDEGDVEGALAAYRALEEGDRPWLAAGLVALSEHGFPRDPMKQVIKMLG